jgi:serine-type D-Ala-D-Ala carboxypeptidase
MQQAVASRVFPAATLLVADEGQPVLHAAYGRARLDTVFDLASLTKPLATTAVLMRLCARGELKPSARLRELLPGADRPGLRQLRLWHLLAHCSGLPAWRPFWQEVAGLAEGRRRSALRRLALAPLEARPGERAVYSDLGFILLEWAIERRTGLRLDRLLAREVTGPLRLTRTCFLERGRALPPFELAAPGKGRPRGVVDDENAEAMGGVAGHAGLFSTAHEVHLLARELWTAWAGGPSVFAPTVVRRFWSARPMPEATRALGWDRPSRVGASCGRYFSEDAVGHLGFTGTSLWIEPACGRWVVLLANRVYYGRQREPNPMRALRPRLHDAVMRALVG